MNSLYSKIDRRDKYIYEKELLRIYHFGLGVQLMYFKLGNDEIIESSDEPDSKSTKSVIDSNIRTLVNNYSIYFDQVNNEKAFSSEGIALYSKGIDIYFTKLINLYPDFNYSKMKQKIITKEKKAKSPEIKEALNNLLKLIESKQVTE
jgi:hypothetical protein